MKHYSQKITDRLYYIGTNDRITELFENMWPLPDGVAYNSYVIKGSKNILLDSVKSTTIEESLRKLDEVIQGEEPVSYKHLDNPSRDKYDLGLIYILEDFAYNREVGKRPVLESLRKSYAKKFLEDKYDLQRRNLALRQNQMYRLEILRMKEILRCV